MTFFITEAGWRMPVWTRETPDFHVPHAEPQLDRQAAAATPPYPTARAQDGHNAGGSILSDIFLYTNCYAGKGVEVPRQSDHKMFANWKTGGGWRRRRERAAGGSIDGRCLVLNDYPQRYRGKNTLNQKKCQGGGFEETFVPVCATAGRWNNKQEGAAAAAHINKCRHLAGALRNFRDQNDIKYVITAS